MAMQLIGHLVDNVDICMWQRSKRQLIVLGDQCRTDTAEAEERRRAMCLLLSSACGEQWLRSP